MVSSYTTHIGEHEIIIETGKLANQASGAVTVTCGESVILVTATVSAKPIDRGDFLPLSVDYEERSYAAGRIPGGFFKREGRPSEQAVLLCRLVDRPIRPLFNKSIRNEIQVIITSLSADPQIQLDILAVIGASAALTISNIPFGGPVGAVRVGYIDGQLVFNPTMDQMTHSTLDLRLAGTEEAILMVEAGAQEVPESLLVEAMRAGHEAIQDCIRMQKQMQAEIGKPKLDLPLSVMDEELLKQVEATVTEPIERAIRNSIGKAMRDESLEAIKTELLAGKEDAAEIAAISAAFEKALQKIVRRMILGHYRPDGRDWEEIRPITCEVGLLPRAHGSGLFTRGETQVLSIATLGTPSDEQTIEGLTGDSSKRYMHHYNFPPYSTGEVKRLSSPGRREIGHGALAERSLEPMIPPEGEFPYTVRVVSEVMSSNGSTSMASVCGSTLSLLDAGVPIKAPVAGIAMGLISEEGQYAVLTDIMGMEDHLGDMDFKVTGTREGVNALQMDIKISGLSYDILSKALDQARRARLFILDKIEAVIPAPRKELSKYAPRMLIIKIDQSKIGAVIGPGGKTIRGIIEETGVKIDINDDGSVYIASSDGAAADAARKRIEGLTGEAKLGQIYTGKVVRTTDFGAFVEILPGIDGMVHISQLADYRAPTVEDVVHVGDEIMVMVTDIEPGSGRIRLSRQAVLEGWTPEEARQNDPGIRSGGRPQGDRPRRPDSRGERPRGGR